MTEPITSPTPPDPAPDGALDPALASVHTAVVAQVRQWLARSTTVRSEPGAARLAALLRDPDGLRFAVAFVDGVVRPDDRAVAARRLRVLAQDVPASLPFWVRVAMRCGGVLGPHAPRIVVGTARRVLRRTVTHLVLDVDETRLSDCLARVSAAGDRVNLNLLGEAVLGAGEGRRRLAGVRRLLVRSDVAHVSVKVSAVVGPHAPWAHDETVDEVVDLLRPLYLVAARSRPAKFINLDMEEYRDLTLTLDVFTRLLDDPGLRDLEAGVVLQAYLPDSFDAMERVQTWAAARRAGGGAPVTVRLVKGANLPMERVDAEVHGWPLATWSTKVETDTQYKRILHRALRPDRVRNVRIGVAGHNLFDVAFAWELAGRRGVRDGVVFEMLLGMAQGQAAAVRETVGPLVVYTPVVRPDEFDAAIAYLVRRLDEASSPENYLSALVQIPTDEDLFEREERRFVASLRALGEVDTQGVGDVADAPWRRPHRVQDRRIEVPARAEAEFVNAPDTDPSTSGNRVWASALLAAVRTGGRADAQTDVLEELADEEAVDLLVGEAHLAGTAWDRQGADHRRRVLEAAADELESRRAQLVEVMIDECAKTLDQADPEVSEAVDFARWYARQGVELHRVDGARPAAVGVTLVTPPWNFPVAIPAGSTLAALAAGSAVVLKPSRHARRCAAELAHALWAAGVPRQVLRLVRTADGEVARRLVSDERVGRVLLTGSYETAELFQQHRTGRGLLAETSGKNAVVVTPSADVDLAVKDVVQSAFGHAGQKCSAASLVILVGSVGSSRRFVGQLVDAVTSLRVGEAWQADTQMGPLIRPADPKLLRGLTQLDVGERWLVEPRRLDDDGRLWTPGVKEGVARGAWFHRVECFGPVLGVMRVATLDDAIAAQNEVDLALTAGLQSLDDTEISTWVAGVEAGNLYVNRATTGAVVARQPFGGWKRSAVGPGYKVGGPHHLVGLVDWTSDAARADTTLDALGQRLLDAARRAVSDPDELAWLERSLASDVEAVGSGVFAERDLVGLISEVNVLRMLPVPTCVRVGPGAEPGSLLRVVAAGVRTSSLAWVSCAEPLPSALSSALSEAVEAAVAAPSGAPVPMPVRVETEARWMQHLDASGVTRVRWVGPSGQLPEALRQRTDLVVHDHAVTEAGRIELLRFLREQAVSVTAHRFGTPVDVLSAVSPVAAPGRPRTGRVGHRGRRRDPRR